MSDDGERTLETRYIEALRKLRQRIDMLEEVAMWKADLASRLWRAEVVLRTTGISLYDAHELERETELLLTIIGRMVAQSK